MIIIEEKARKLITEGIKIEEELTNYENKSKIKGKLLINDKKSKFTSFTKANI